MASLTPVTLSFADGRRSSLSEIESLYLLEELTRIKRAGAAFHAQPAIDALTNYAGYTDGAAEYEVVEQAELQALHRALTHMLNAGQNTPGLEELRQIVFQLSEPKRKVYTLLTSLGESDFTTHGMPYEEDDRLVDSSGLQWVVKSVDHKLLVADPWHQSHLSAWPEFTIHELLKQRRADTLEHSGEAPAGS